MKIIKVPANVEDAASIVEIDGSLQSMRDAIGGGWIERVNTRMRITEDIALVMVVDEDGISKRLPLNPRAMFYYPGLIYGDVFFCGEARQGDGDIDFVSMPDGYELVLE